MNANTDVFVLAARHTGAMNASEPVHHIRPGDRVEADPTPGMTRERAIEVEGLWAGLVRTEPAMTSGWHHHGDYETSIYVARGTLRMESGPAGSEVINAEPGDFLHVPKGAIHRESNRGEDESHLIVVRAGRGVPTINVDGPVRLTPAGGRRCCCCRDRELSSGRIRGASDTGSWTTALTCR